MPNPAKNWFVPCAAGVLAAALVALPIQWDGAFTPSVAHAENHDNQDIFGQSQTGAVGTDDSAGEDVNDTGTDVNDNSADVNDNSGGDQGQGVADNGGNDGGHDGGDASGGGDGGGDGGGGGGDGGGDGGGSD